MKTFEEFRFKVKHSAINTAIPLQKLEVGDYIYMVRDDEYVCFKITKIEVKDNCKILYSGKKFVELYSNEEDMKKNFIKFENPCTLITDDDIFHCVITTDKNTAERYNEKINSGNAALEMR